MAVQMLALLTINEDEPQALAEYFAGAEPLMREYGGRLVKRFYVNDVGIGRTARVLAVLVEYPSVNSAEALLGSAAYARIRPARDRAFLDYSVAVVQGVVEGAV